MKTKQLLLSSAVALGLGLTGMTFAAPSTSTNLGVKPLKAVVFLKFKFGSSGNEYGVDKAPIPSFLSCGGGTNQPWDGDENYKKLPADVKAAIKASNFQGCVFSAPFPSFGKSFVFHSTVINADSKLSGKTTVTYNYNPFQRTTFNATNANVQTSSTECKNLQSNYKTRCATITGWMQ